MVLVHRFLVVSLLTTLLPNLSSATSTSEMVKSDESLESIDNNDVTVTDRRNYYTSHLETIDPNFWVSDFTLRPASPSKNANGDDNNDGYNFDPDHTTWWFPPPPPPPDHGPPPNHGPPPPRDATTKPKETEKDKEEKTHRLQLGLGLGLGLPLLIILLLALFFVFHRWYLTRKQQSSVSPILASESKLSTPSSQHSYLQPRGHAGNDYSSGPRQDVEPGLDVWEVDASRLSVDYNHKLGSGAFCNVYKGHLRGPAPVCRLQPVNLTATAELTDCPVAVKALPPFADDFAKSDFQQEINFMKRLRYHAHLASMLGWTRGIHDGSPLLLVEYCALGDLLHFVRAHKQDVETAYTNVNANLRVRDLVSFAWQICSGLEYLGACDCIHRDIAARNVLLDSRRCCKIADFGLCRLTDTLLYTARGGRLPLKWMAPESLRSFEYSDKSDVWSYGVLLWELFSLGSVPYALIPVERLLNHLDSGARLEVPTFATPLIASLMHDCWSARSSDRPNFTTLGTRLAVELEAASEDYGYVRPSQGENNEGDDDGDAIAESSPDPLDPEQQSLRRVASLPPLLSSRSQTQSQ